MGCVFSIRPNFATSGEPIEKARQAFQRSAKEAGFFHRAEGPRQFGNIVSGAYTPVLAKHSKHFSPGGRDSPLPWSACSEISSRCTGQVEGGRQIQATDDPAKLIIYRVLVETVLDAPKYLVRDAHDACAGNSRFRSSDQVGESGPEAMV
jgi:hypothetical protein